MRRIPAAGIGRAVVRDQRRGAVGGGGIKAASKAFLQAFPNLACFCPSFSKQSFGHFVGFQWVARAKNQKGSDSKFFRPSRLLLAVFSALSRPLPPTSSPLGGVCDARNGRVHCGGVIRIERI
jgi:hypothetical protein